MVVTDFEFGGTVYQCRIVKDNSGDDLIIGSTAFLDALHRLLRNRISLLRPLFKNILKLTGIADFFVALADRRQSVDSDLHQILFKITVTSAFVSLLQLGNRHA